MRFFKQDLRELDLFSEVTRSEMAVIAKQLTRLKVKAGRVLVREGGFGNEFMIMVSGMAEVTKDGRSIATLGRGDLVGEMALLQPHGAGPSQRHCDCCDRRRDLRRLGDASSAAFWRPLPRWRRRSARRSRPGLSIAAWRPSSLDDRAPSALPPCRRVSAPSAMVCRRSVDR